MGKIEISVAQMELDGKIAQIRSLLESRDLDALLLKRVSSFAWATCGTDSYINRASTEGVASLLITHSDRYVIANNIEYPRLKAEENLFELGWKMCISPWYSPDDQVAELTKGMKLGADGSIANGADLSWDVAWMRAQLTVEEGKRFRNLGKLCADAMRQAIDELHPGMSEYEIAGLLSHTVESRGVQVIVNLVAVDERISAFRHPLPTYRKLKKYAMLVLCGRKRGLVCSITRLVHFGRLPDDIRCRSEATARVDAALISATRPGSTLGQVFRSAQDQYAEAGFPGEWQHHHQGGLAGYEPREITATPESDHQVLVGQAYAWNPSIKGTKSEDTILVGERENEMITQMVGWPSFEIQMDGKRILRPAIMEK